MNARFWVYHNDDVVKLTLRPAQSLTAWTYTTDEEGWCATSEHWSHEGDSVVNTWDSIGVDCDGKLRTGGSRRAALDKLHEYRYEPGEPKFPKWEDTAQWQRDYQAEAAGY